MSKTKYRICILCLLSTFLLASEIGWSEDKKDPAVKTTDSKDVGKEAERALSAANVLLEVVKTPESGIPQDLLNHADAIAVIPNVVKGAFGVGGRHGKASWRGAFQTGDGRHRLSLKSVAAASACRSVFLSPT